MQEVEEGKKCHDIQNETGTVRYGLCLLASDNVAFAIHSRAKNETIKA
jgi:hypothetical protein